MNDESDDRPTIDEIHIMLEQFEDEVTYEPDGTAVLFGVHRDSASVMQEDLRELLQVLGIGARPESPHGAMQGAIRKARGVRRALNDAGERLARLAEIQVVARRLAELETGVHPDAYIPKANHYDWYVKGLVPDPAKNESDAQVTDEWLAETRREAEEMLGDVFCDDAGFVMLKLLDHIDRLAASEDPPVCGSCGSTDIFFDPGDGWSCNSCMATDGDDG